jgi:hypothetical protein
MKTVINANLIIKLLLNVLNVKEENSSIITNAMINALLVLEQIE